VHQWQAETGLAVNHLRSFRQKAVEVGIEPQARRIVARPGHEGRRSVGRAPPHSRAGRAC